MVRADVMQRIKRPAVVRRGNRASPERATAGARTVAFLALLSAAALSPQPARAQVFITNSEHFINEEPAVGAPVSISGTQNRIVLAQPFTIPAAAGPTSIRQVAVYLGDISGGSFEITPGIRVEVAIYNTKANPVCGVTEATPQQAFDCQFAPIVPTSGRMPENFYNAADANRIDNYIVQLENPARLSNGRNVFNVPAGTAAFQPGTYAVYVGAGLGTGQAITTRGGDDMDVGECSSGEFNSDANEPGRYLDKVTNQNAAWGLGLTVSDTFGGRFGSAADGSPTSSSDLYIAHQGRTILIDIIGEPNHEPSGLALTGALELGGTLTADTSGVTDANGLAGDVVYARQWTRAETDGTGEQDIAGETGETYALVDADRNMQVGARVNFVDEHCYPNSLHETRDFVRADNQPAGGEVTIELSDRTPGAPGAPDVGETLEANTDGITDGNGRVGVTFNYQWVRADDDAGANEENIGGATGQTYVLTRFDANKRIRVDVDFNDQDRYPEELSSDYTVVVNGPATGRPAISGSPPAPAQEGVELTVGPGNIADANGLTGVSYNYQWERVDAAGANPENIAGATGTAYTLQPVDVGHRVQVKVTFTDDAGYNEERTSLTVPENLEDPADVIIGPDNIEPVGEPRIAGDFAVGEVLTATYDPIMDGNGLTRARAGEAGYAFAYQWVRVDDDGTSNQEDIPGASGNSYALTDADGNKIIRVRVTYTDDDGYEEEVLSTNDDVVDAPATGMVTIDGVPRVGEVLTANTDAVMDPNGLDSVDFSYQWVRLDVAGNNPEDISGAAERTYALTAAEGNRRIRVRVRFTDDDGGDPVELTSGATAVVDAPATGMPTITGAVQVGATLTANTEDVMDPNGVTRATYAYQWQRVDDDGMSNPVDIRGAADRTYVPAAADGDRRIWVRVRFTDDAGYDEERISAATGPVDVPAEGDVTVDGAPQVGETLTANTDQVTDPNGLPAAPAFTYQWQRAAAADGTGEADIRGATAAAYVNAEADQNNWVRVTVRFQDADGNNEMLSSEWTEIMPEANMPATGLRVTGRAQVGRTLTADTSQITDPNGATRASYAYQWQRVEVDANGVVSNPMDIAGADARTYAPDAADSGLRIRVRVRFADDDGNDEELASAPTEAVAARDARAEPTVEKSLLLFGRTAAMQMLDTTRLRLDAQCAPGSQLTVAGHRVGGWDADKAEEGAWQALRRLSRFNGMSGRDALTSSSFSLARDGMGSGCVSVWGRGSHSSYADKEHGLEVDGSVTTGQVGADWSSERWMLGLSVAHSVGGSDYQVEDGGEGDMDIDLTGVYPYTRYRFTERFSSWAAGGLGMGDVEYKPQGGDAIRTDIDLLMGAAGFRGELLTADAAAGFAVAVKADAFYVQMESDEVEGQLGATSADTRRVRLGLEGSHLTELPDGSTIAPSLELGVLHDRGGLSTGSGMDLGLGLTYENPGRGFWVDFRGRSLLTHEAGSLQEWGVSGEVRYDLDLSSERGFAMSLNSGYGARARGGAEALFNLRDVDLLSADRDLPSGRLDAEIGYGLGAFGGRFVSRPWAGLGMTETGSEWRLGWRLAPAAGQSPLRLGVEVLQRNSDHAVMLNFGAGGL